MIKNATIYSSFNINQPRNIKWKDQICKNIARRAGEKACYGVISHKNPGAFNEKA